jgi:opacity protein-like surface antigen
MGRHESDLDGKKESVENAGLMRSLKPILLIGCAGLAIFAIPLNAAQDHEDYERGFYFRGDIGPAETEDTEVRSFVGPVSKVKIEFDTGVRVGAAGGYSFCPWFALEGEIGWVYNEVDTILGGIAGDARVMQAPFLGNAVLQYKNSTGLTPFIGAGAGVSISILQLDDATSGAVSVEGTAGDTVFAWQAFGGLRYDFNKRLGIGIMYKYLSTDDAEWDVQGAAQDIEFEGMQTHSLSVVVTFQF